MKRSQILDLASAERGEVLHDTATRILAYFDREGRLPMANGVKQEEILAYLEGIDFNKPSPALEALDFICNGLEKYQVHTPNPGYFGLFNPATTFMGVIADALVAAYNPQLAAWNHSPLPNEIENRLINEFGKLLLGALPVDGTFTSGGEEANHTALLAALTHHFPGIQEKGLQAIDERPVFYVSAESHHSFLKAARLCGLGAESVRRTGVDSSFSMNVSQLKMMLEQDRRNGLHPFLIIATAGTTNSGAIDPLGEAGDTARENNCWYHVDAAWGGAVSIDPVLKKLLAGIEKADSVTFDAHKWLSVPMGAGMFITRHTEILRQTFGVDTAYMPVKNPSEVTNPFHHSIQWSRRFTGLKLYLTLATAGWDGYREVIMHMLEMGRYLRRRLTEEGGVIITDSPLPVSCFTPMKSPKERDLPLLEDICRQVVSSGNSWISTTILNSTIPVLRACITNYRTDEKDIEGLVDLLNKAR